MPTISPCQHCGEQRTPRRRRGLCWRCYQCPDISARAKPNTQRACASCRVPRGRWRRRGLCWQCYATDKVRKQHPVVKRVGLAAVAGTCWACGQTRTQYRRRRLCRECYFEPAVRARFEQVVVCGMGALDRDFEGDAAAATARLDAPPGREDRIAQLAERVRLKQALFEDDAWRPDLR